MIKNEDILITGGSGLLGSELRRLLPNAKHPTSKELDVSYRESVFNYFRHVRPKFVIHCAGFMPANKSETNPEESLAINITGTCLITFECMVFDTPIIYISSDYVFKGDKGNYKETDELLPINKYAWSKLGGECAVRMYDKGLIVRTSFGPPEFPHPTAFTDQWHTRQPVNIIAKKIVSLIGKEVYGVIHLGGGRQSDYEYATRLSPNKKIEQALRNKPGYTRPKDTSLNTNKYQSLIDYEIL
jgi:dTDP-4-dehydrorhamnose reductase